MSSRYALVGGPNSLGETKWHSLQNLSVSALIKHRRLVKLVETEYAQLKQQDRLVFYLFIHNINRMIKRINDELVCFGLADLRQFFFLMTGMSK